MEKEIFSLAKNETWKLINKPEGKRFIGCSKENLELLVLKRRDLKQSWFSRDIVKLKGLTIMKFFSQNTPQ